MMIYGVAVNWDFCRTSICNKVVGSLGNTHISTIVSLAAWDIQNQGFYRSLDGTVMDRVDVDELEARGDSKFMH
ncbi:hypothetical protein AWENTII_004829 [Aspergillus wentii]